MRTPKWVTALCSAPFLCLATASFADQLNLAWDPSPDPVSGYVVHYGTSPGTYTQTNLVGNATSATISNLTEGATYYFAVTAYVTIDSDFSNEVSQKATPRIVSVKKVGAQIQLLFNSMLSRHYQVERNTSFATNTWTVIATGVPGTGAPIQVNDPYVAGTPLRVYRVGGSP